MTARMTTVRMPAETEPHQATWMAWPSKSYTLGETAADAAEARATWAAVANAIVEFEPVHMLVPPSERFLAPAFLKPQIQVHEVELDDAWFRDIGPTFVVANGALTSPVTLVATDERESTATGQCIFNLATATTPAHGLCTYSGGTGKLAGFHAIVIVEPPANPAVRVYPLAGTYWFDRDGEVD